MGVIHGERWTFFFPDEFDVSGLMFFGTDGKIVFVEDEEADEPTIVCSPVNKDQ